MSSSLGGAGITDAVHSAGGRISLRLWHVGRISHPILLSGEMPVASLRQRAARGTSPQDGCWRQQLLQPGVGFPLRKYRSKPDTDGMVRGDKVADYLNDRGLKILSALNTVEADTEQGLQRSRDWGKRRSPS
jgi:hypothetical protein